MKKTAHTQFWLALVALFSSVGCVNVSVDRQSLERRYFVLDATNDGVPGSSNSTGILKISNLRVAPHYDGKGFVYRTADMSYETDYYNQFLVPPGAMLTDEVQQALTRSNIFQYTVNSESQLEPTHRLEGAVDALYGDFSDRTAPQAVLGMSFLLSREAADGPEVIFQRRYRRAVPVQRRTPEALVRGWNEGLEAILASLVADLKATALRDFK